MKKTIRRKTATKSIQVPQRSLAAKVKLVEAGIAKMTHPDFAAGDTVRVHCKIKEGEKERIQVYEVVVIAKGNKDAGKSFNVRKISHGVGVERIFLENSPRIAKIEVVQKGRVRRAKLYYIRELEGRAARIEKEIEHTSVAADSKKAASPAKTKA